MRYRIYALISVLMFAFRVSGQEPGFKNVNFQEFIKQTEERFDVKFFYDEAEVRDIRINSEDCSGLTCILDNAFKGTGLFYLMEESGNIIVTHGYQINVPGGSVNRDTVFPAPGDFYVMDEADSGAVTVSVEVGNPADKNKKGNVMMSGYITGSDTKEPIQGVTVYIKKLSMGTTTNQFGYYSLLLPRGTHMVQFSFIGMREKHVNIMLYGTGELNADMKSVLIPLRETVVSAGKSLTMQRFETGAEKINITSFRLLPTTMGESDIMKSMLMIPGVVSVGEASAGFNVRGGSADQNLVLLYGAPVYNPSHFFGFFSSVNPDIIRDVTLYKGGIPGRYGGRISSVLDIVSREGNRREFKGRAGISPVATHLSLEGPLLKDTLTYLVTGRTTYSNWIFNLTDNPMLNKSRAAFRDLNAKIVYDPDRNNKFDISFYHSHDDFRFRFDTVYSYNNNIAAARWRHFFNPVFFSTFSLNNSYYEYNVSSDFRTFEAFSLSHSINSTGFTGDFNWFKGKHEFNFGTNLTRYSVNPGSYSPLSDSSLVVEHLIERERGWEGAFYFDDKLKISDVLSINLGLRISTYLATGPASALTGKIIRTYGGPEFRIAANFVTADNNSIKLNYNKTRQYLHLLSNSASISPTDIWKLSDYDVRPQTGDQLSAGFYQLFPGNNSEFSAEIFYKSIKNINDFKAGTKLVMNENIEEDLLNMKGKAYGIELQLKNQEGKARYSVGYSWSRTLIRSTSDLKNEKINSGRWFPANFDRPHDLTVMFNYIFTRRFSVSSNYVLSSGRAMTYPVAFYRLFDDILLHYSDRNRYRLPAYARLDLSFRINGNLKSKKLADPYLSFSVYNVLARRNIYSVFFRNQDDALRGYSLSVFGTAIPSLNIGFDF